MKRKLGSEFIDVELNIGGVIRKFTFKFIIDESGVVLNVSGYKKASFHFNAWDFEKLTRALFYDARTTRLCNNDSRSRS